MSNQSMYAMYVIGKVESNHNWASVNTTDPITFGMMQWFGTRAYGLLVLCSQRDAEGWAAFKAAAPALGAHVENNDVNWPTYYTNAAEENAWRQWATRDLNHAAQQEQWETDYVTYSKQCDSIGIPSENMQVRILFMTAYHQGPKYALRVIRSVGVMSTLDRLHDGLLADGVLGRYRNRYNTAYDLLKTWDGQSAPPDFGQSGGGETQPDHGGDTAPSVQPTPDKPVMVTVFGNDLVYNENGTKKRLYKTSAQSWQGGTITGQTIAGGGTGGGQSTGGGDSSGNASGDAAKVLKWISDRMGKFNYSQGPGRLNPDATGYTDCSGLIWSAYHFAIGKDIGTWTGTEQSLGTEVANSSTSSVADAIAKVKAADILVIDWARNGVTGDYDHEEIFTGDGSGHLYSHGGPGKGPSERQFTDQAPAMVRWKIRRHL